MGVHLRNVHVWATWFKEKGLTVTKMDGNNYTVSTSKSIEAKLLPNLGPVIDVLEPTRTYSIKGLLIKGRMPVTQLS